MLSDFTSLLRKYWKKSLTGLSLVAGVIIAPLLVYFNSTLTRIIWILTVLLVLVLSTFVVTFRQYQTKKDEISELKSQLEEREEYYNLIDEKYTLPVDINMKSLSVEITEKGDDDLHYEYTISAAEGKKIDKFHTLIGTDKETDWADLNLTTNGAQVSDHRRRDFENFTRFIITLNLDRVVDDNESYKISYSVSHNVVDVDDDYAYQIIRHETEKVKISLVYPDGWDPNRHVATLDGESEIVDVPQPKTERNEDDSEVIKWSSTDCSVGERYKIDYTAEQK